jgi:hypothetical protein
MTDSIALIRQQLAGLISQIDTAEKPRPHVINGPDHAVPGPEWRPVKGYTIRAADPDGLQPPPDCVHVIWPDAEWSGDMDAMRPDDARRLAMALLAAADWADGVAAGVPQLDSRRTEPLAKENSQ